MKLKDICRYGANDITLPPSNQITFFKFTYVNVRTYSPTDCYYDVTYPIETNNYSSFLSNLSHWKHHYSSCGCFSHQLSKQSNESFFLKIIELSPIFLIAYSKHVIANSYSQSYYTKNTIDIINNLYRKYADQCYERRSYAVIALQMQDI